MSYRRKNFKQIHFCLDCKKPLSCCLWGECKSGRKFTRCRQCCSKYLAKKMSEFPLSPKGIPHLTYRGKKHPNWRGGIMHSQGYIAIKKWEHPFHSTRGYVKEHRLVMEKYLGRYLQPNEMVHHKNNIRNDNRIENLEVTNKSEHYYIHYKKIVCPYCHQKFNLDRFNHSNKYSK